MRLKVYAAALGLAVFVGRTARADPCKAIPDRGPMPNYLHPGSTFSGPVAYVGDGDSLCVAVGRGPENWVEVRLSDFYAPELHEAGGERAKASLKRITMGRSVSCVADHRSYDRVVAACTLNGRDLGDSLRAAGGREGGRAWRPRH
jgi:endonuclease YncB( thermonuclease family)